VSYVSAAARRRIKVHAANLGPLLCWAIVFADIGTSIYYVPGIVSSSGYNKRTAIFVAMTAVAFVLLALKYAEVTWRNPEGGGVVTISSRALHPFVGLLGGLFIIVDYYLTAGLSAFSGVSYLAVVFPVAAWGNALPGTLLAIVALAALNVLGIRESATVSFVAAVLAAAGQLLVVLIVAVALGPAGIVHSIQMVRESPPPLTPVVLLFGFGAAFLAFSGLESVAQIAPAMRSPRRRTAYRTMGLVIVAMLLTSPILSLWQTVLVPNPNDPVRSTQLLSLLAGQYASKFVADYVAITGAVLLLFATNTAIIGGYHVFLALTRMGFLPRAVELRNSWRRTPHIAILASILPPIAIVAVASTSSAGTSVFLGNLYAFGLLGSIILTNVALDVIRRRELKVTRGAWPRILFGIGVFTTALPLVAWLVNLVAKPDATIFGGALTGLGLIVGLTTYRRGRRRRPAVFPVPYRPELANESIAMQFQAQPADVLVVLPRDQNSADAVIAEGSEAGQGRSVVFLYRGQAPPGPAELWEVSDPYLKDYVAQDAFTRAEMRSRAQVPSRRYVYVPGSLPRDAIGRVWAEVHPHETVVLQGEQDVLPPLALDRIKHRVHSGVPVLHLMSSRVRREPAAAAAAG
jgi:amino acid transporter